MQITKPTLFLDEQICRRNIERMRAKMAGQQINFRPHFKTHQSRQIGEWFRNDSIETITVSSLGMAEYFANAGWSDITVAFPVNILEHTLINRLGSHIRLNLLAEDPEVIRKLDGLLNTDVGLYLKIDTGTHRTGLSPDAHDDISRCIESLSGARHLRWKGFLAHAGHTYAVRRDTVALSDIYRKAIDSLNLLRDKFRQDGSELQISFGDTPGASMLDKISGIDEMRPGNFVFYDLMQVQIGSCALEDIAVALVCPVVATHFGRNELVLYGGGIHLSKDHLVSGNGAVSFGSVCKFDGARFDTGMIYGELRSLSQEHGVMRISSTEAHALRAGDLVAVLPVHSCMTAQCMGSYTGSAGQTYDHYAGAGRA